MPAQPSVAPDLPAVPMATCPGCGHVEATGFVGESSGAVVQANRVRFTDAAGFLHCAECGLVIDRLWFLPEENTPEGESAPLRSAREHEDADAGFNPHEAENTAAFMRLARAAMRYGAAKQGATLSRALDRITDAEALCALLELPPQITAAVVHHVRLLSRVDLRDISAERRVVIRSEAAVVATVLLVMDRFFIERPGAERRMRAAFRFQRGARELSDAEVDGAYLGLAAWFGRNVWRDGPEDRPQTQQVKKVQNESIQAEASLHA